MIANCELVTAAAVGTTVLGEKLTPDQRRGWRADPRRILLYGWVREPPQDRIAEKSRMWRVDLPPAHHGMPDGCMAVSLILNSRGQFRDSQRPLSLSSGNGP
jgi:hypothetical protein